MATFDLGETVICSITVRDSANALQDPITSMKIVIDKIKPNSQTDVVASTNMTDDAGDGAYHYDFQTATASAGDYRITYTATDSTRITIQKDTFTLE